LNLTVKSDRPVILVGAMRPATALSADGPLNLLNAVRTAIALARAGRGARPRRPTVDPEVDVSHLTQLPKVDIVYSYVEPDTAMIDALVARKAKGLVFAGTGAGALSTFEKATVTALWKLPAADRPVIVRSSRVGNGRVIGRPEFDSIGTVPADNLNPQKARILLMLALTRTTDPKEI